MAQLQRHVVDGGEIGREGAARLAGFQVSERRLRQRAFVLLF